MEPRIETLQEKKLVGKRVMMSLANNTTAELWRSFMPRHGEITNKLTSDFISMSIYRPAHFVEFKPTNEFEKWAAVEVEGFENVPADMDTFILPGGLYAVFDYKGKSSDSSIFRYIFTTWLPGSQFELDARPHFEILGEKYKNNDPESEEEIWVPVRERV